MRPEQLAEMLELEMAADAAVVADPIAEGKAGGAAGAAGSTAPKAAPSDYAVKMDKWGARRGQDLFKQEEFAKMAASPEQREYWPKALADFHAAAYEVSPELAECPKDQMRADFLKTLMETPEFQQVRVSTTLNPAAAEVATAAFGAQYSKRLAEAKQHQQQQPKPGQKDNSAPAVDDEIATMKAAAQAVAAAQAAVNELNEASEMCGLGGSGDGSPRDAKRIAAAYRRVKHSPRLRKIAELAGRFRRLAASKQRMKVSHGVDEVIGVTLGDEIGRLIPAELMKLVDEDLELDTARRVLERQAQVRETRATEPAGRGPIVVTVDESGSMSSREKIETAKALALALAWVARKQNRWCALVGFSGGTQGHTHLIPPGKADEAGLLAWLEHFYGGGTQLDVPIREVPGMWERFVASGMARGKTDMVMITDGLCNLEPRMRDEFLAFKAAEKVRMTTLVIDSGDEGAANIHEISDEVYCMPGLGTDEAAVGRVLSV